MSDKLSIPNALYVVAVSLGRHSGGTVTKTMTQSWSTGTREFAVAHALEFALKEKPDFSIDQWLVTEVPLPPIQIDDGDIGVSVPEEGLRWLTLDSEIDAARLLNTGPKQSETIRQWLMRDNRTAYYRERQACLRLIEQRDELISELYGEYPIQGHSS